MDELKRDAPECCRRTTVSDHIAADKASGRLCCQCAYGGEPALAARDCLPHRGFGSGVLLLAAHALAPFRGAKNMARAGAQSREIPQCGLQTVAIGGQVVVIAGLLLENFKNAPLATGFSKKLKWGCARGVPKAG